MSSGRRTFGPVVLLGLASAGAAALGGHRPMLTIPPEEITNQGGLAVDVAQRSVEFPLAGALALVALASWGALLVTRGVVRRAVAVLAALAGLGVVLVVVFGGFIDEADAVRNLSDSLGYRQALEAERSGWLWLTAAAGAMAFVAALAALRWVPDWPEMGTRYDAPGAAGAATAGAGGAGSAGAGEVSNIDLWKSLDEGADPTAD